MHKRKTITSDIAIINNNDESSAIIEGLNKIKISETIDNTDTVVITPNWVNAKKPDPSDAIIVGQESLRTIIEYFKNLNPKRIVVATGSGSKETKDVMKKVGYDKIIQDTQVEFIDLNKPPFTDLSLNHSNPSSTKINSLINEVTCLVSFTQLKHHEESTISASIKNIALGWPPAEIHGYPKKDLGIHDDLHGFITAMAEKISIDVAILSCNPVMIGSGPSNGIAKHTGIVVCGTDAIAVDTVGARFLGFKPQAIRYLYDCEKLKLGITDIKRMNIHGLKLIKAEEIFSKAVYGKKIAIDKK